RVWEFPSGKPIRHFGLEENDAFSTQDSGRYFPNGRPVALSKDGKFVACLFDGHGVRLYEVATGKELPALRSAAADEDRPYGPVVAIDFAPDGKTLATLDFDGTVRVWDWARTEQLRSFRGTGLPDSVRGYARL